MLAGNLSSLAALAAIPEITQVAALASVSLDQAAARYMAVSEDLSVSRLLSLGAHVKPADTYEEQALDRCLDEISMARVSIVTTLLKASSGKGASTQAKMVMAESGEKVRGELKLLADLTDMSLAKFVVASGILNQLARDTVK